jgi:hypothetical protein
MTIGKIVKSNAHIDYVCQVYGKNEIGTPPTPEDHAFGNFVRMKLDTQPDRWLVGVIYNTILMNPDFGNLGPRLSPPEDLSTFSPDYLNEKAVLIGIITVGMMGDTGDVVQGVTPLAASVDALVERMTDDQVRAFHRNGSALTLGYMPLLMAQQNAVIAYLLLKIITDLESHFPDQCSLLAVLKNDLAWKANVTMVGGRA